jgi:hypothetical protein
MQADYHTITFKCKHCYSKKHGYVLRLNDIKIVEYWWIILGILYAFIQNNRYYNHRIINCSILTGKYYSNTCK